MAEARRRPGDVDGAAIELNVECVGGYGWQHNAQRIAGWLYRHLVSVAGPPPTAAPDFSQMDPGEGVLGLVGRLLRRRASGGRPLFISISGEDQHGTDGEELWLLRAARERLGVDTALVAPEWVEPGGAYRGVPITAALNNTDPRVQLPDGFLDLKPYQGLTDLFAEDRTFNAYGALPGGTRAAMGLLHRRRHTLPHPLSALIPVTTPLPQLGQDAAGAALSAWVFKREGSSGGSHVLMGGRDDDAMRALLGAPDAACWVAQAQVDGELWRDTFTTLRGGGLQRSQMTLDTRLFFGHGGLVALLNRFNERPPTNVCSGGGIQPCAVVPDAAAARALRRWYTSALDRLSAADVHELGAQLTERMVQAGQTHQGEEVRTTLEPRIFTLGEVRTFRRLAQQSWDTFCDLIKGWEDGSLRAHLPLSPLEARLAQLQPFTGQETLLALDVLTSAGTSARHG